MTARETELTPETGRPTPARGFAAAVIRDALDASVQRLLAADPVVRAGTDAEGVHQARVATRRLRSDLRTFGPLLEEEWATPLSDGLRWLGGELGVAREAEVLLGHLRDKAHAAGPEVERDARLLLTAALNEHDAAQMRVIAALHTSGYLDLVDRLVQGAMAPRIRPSGAPATSRDLVRLVRRPWKRLARAHKALGDDPSDPELHALRIRAKRARYAVEAVAGAVGSDEPAKFAAALTNLQDVLGAHQDAVVATTWLHEHSSDADPTEAFAAGVIAGLLRADAQAARDALPDAWLRASRRRLRAFLSR